jgi:hypothetical protein
MNYVDATNIDLAREVTELSGRAGYGGQAQLAAQFGKAGRFERRMSKTQRDLPWSEFKTWPRPEDSDDFTWSPPIHTLAKLHSRTD